MNNETFTELYERCGASIMKSVVAQTRDEQLAEEICQQTFLIYYENMDHVRPDMEKAWLFKVARNLLIDYWRKASTRNEVLALDECGEMSSEGSSGNPEELTETRLFVCDLLEDLKKRNVRWYEIAVHVYLLQESYEEAAELLGTNAAVLRARWNRAKRYIIKKYGKDYLDE